MVSVFDKTQNIKSRNSFLNSHMLIWLGNAWWRSLLISFFNINFYFYFYCHSYSFAMSSSSGATKGIAAVAQLRSTSNKLANLAAVAECARLAKRSKASMLFLPECFGFIGESSDQTLENAEDPLAIDNHTKIQNHESVSSFLKYACTETPESSLGGTSPGSQISILDGLRTIAKETKLWISGGGVHVGGAPPDDTGGGPRVYNTHVILDQTGNVQALYRKIHLFDVSIPGKVELRESKTTAPGTEVVVCDSPLGKLIQFCVRRYNLTHNNSLSISTLSPSNAATFVIRY